MKEIQKILNIGTPMHLAHGKSIGDIQAWREAQMQKAIEEDRKARDAQLAEYLRNKLGNRFKDRTFDTFEVNADTERAYKICKKFADRESYKDGKGILLSGSYGTGKTHLMASVTNRLLDRGIPCLFDTFSGHTASLIEEFNNGEPRKYLNLMKRVPVLVIDDAGKEKVSEWSQSVMYDVINTRYESYKPILITTNFSHDDLMRYLGGAIYSRLKEICYAAELTGKDHRRW